jgi:hypothetical protein
MTARMPDWLEPMAATLTQDRFTGPEWWFERKIDGIRLLAYKHGPQVRLCEASQEFVVGGFTDPRDEVHDAGRRVSVPSSNLLLTSHMSWATLLCPTHRSVCRVRARPCAGELRGSHEEAP